MFGMIKNSLLGTAELWPCRLLRQGGKLVKAVVFHSYRYTHRNTHSPLLRPSLEGPVYQVHLPQLFPDETMATVFREEFAEEEVAYEERAYEGGKFATVELTGKPYDEAVKESVLKLLKYVGGSNDQGVGMGMMAPVCTTVFPAEDGSLQHKVKVLLRIPSQFQAIPPSPTDESIRIEDREEMMVYSMQFGGYAKETDFVNYAAKLTSALGNEEMYHKDFYFCNGYDPPMKPYGRRNEVWLLKK